MQMLSILFAEIKLNDKEIEKRNKQTIDTNEQI